MSIKIKLEDEKVLSGDHIYKKYIASGSKLQNQKIYEWDGSFFNLLNRKPFKTIQDAFKNLEYISKR